MTDAKNINGEWKIDYGNSLCEMKNDYGEGVYITKAYFLDLKRYLLIFSNNKAKAKFLGLNFEKAGYSIAGQEYLDDPEDIKRIEKLYIDLRNTEITNQSLSVIQEKWSRKNNEIIINKQEVGYSIVASSRAEWINDEFYPKDYNFENPERIINRSLDYATDSNSLLYENYSKKESFYKIVAGKVKSKVPLVYSVSKFSSSVKIPTDFYFLDKKYYKRYKDLNEMIEVCEYGLTCNKPVKLDDTYQLSCVSEKLGIAYMPILTKEELKDIQDVCNGRKKSIIPQIEQNRAMNNL